MSSSSPTTPHRHPAKMLERALSSRRGAAHGDDPAIDIDDTVNGKTKKNQQSFFYATRVSNYLTRLGSGSPWPCAIVLFLIPLLVLVSSLFLSSHGLVCISSYDPVSRANFFGFDGLESDFGALGVPWCESLCLI